MTQPGIGHDSAMALSDEEMEQLAAPKKRPCWPERGTIIREETDPNLVWVSTGQGFVLSRLVPGV